GIAPLALAPAGLMLVTRSRPARWLASFCLLQTVLWFCTQKEMRFLLPVVAVACAFAGAGAIILWERHGRLVRGLVAALLLSHYAYGLAAMVRDRSDRLRALTSEAARERRLNQRIPYRAAYDFLNQCRDVHVVLILDWRVPTYYLDHDHIKVT